MDFHPLRISEYVGIFRRNTSGSMQQQTFLKSMRNAAFMPHCLMAECTGISGTSAFSIQINGRRFRELRSLAMQGVFNRREKKYCGRLSGNRRNMRLPRGE